MRGMRDRELRRGRSSQSRRLPDNEGRIKDGKRLVLKGIWDIFGEMFFSLRSGEFRKVTDSTFISVPLIDRAGSRCLA